MLPPIDGTWILDHIKHALMGFLHVWPFARIRVQTELQRSKNPKFLESACYWVTFGVGHFWKGLIWGKSLILRCQKQMIELCLQDVPVDMYIYIYINRYVHGWKYNRQHRRSQRKRFGWACAILVWACDIFVVTPYFLPRYWGRSPWAKLPETR